MTPTQLKAKVRNLAREKELNPQLVLRYYMMEKFLEEISESEFRDNFVLKGGFLIGSKYGIENRTTKDIDTTIRNLKLTRKTLEAVLKRIFSKTTKDGIRFEIVSIKETREADFYPGFRLNILAHLEKMTTDFKVDITTGDSIYPNIVTTEHKLLFENKTIQIAAYPTEQILAEKLSTTFGFLDVNSRAKDFYDLYKIPKMEPLDMVKVKNSVRNTFTKRGRPEPLKKYYEEGMEIIKNSIDLRRSWEAYQKDNIYTIDISYQDTVESIDRLMKDIINVE
ncbi:nucleotidyl transferase AbiEii/AbiGii toxin family protein [Enterococcus sp. AZ109]|uniref:nucleotidyl transferase AbiEii/AbiGii toxin family protein n=1 Tax=Enterococcus sp. AZ109 TaxID=2774634 RepID=UPI003F22CA59